MGHVGEKKRKKKRGIVYAYVTTKTENFFEAEVKRQKMTKSDFIEELLTNIRDGKPYITHQERRAMRKAEKELREAAEQELDV